MSAPNGRGLNPEQAAAVERGGEDVCVLAGPGSGKTRVLIERFCRLVETGQADPGRILAITFTEKAANEIKARLRQRLGQDDRLRRAIEHAYVSTIHAFCARLLRENALAASVDPGFAILEPPADSEMLEEAAIRALDSLLAESPQPMRRLMEATAAPARPGEHRNDLAGDLIAAYLAMRVAGDDPQRDAPPPAPSLGLADCVRAVRDAAGPDTAWNSSTQRGQLAELRAWLAAAAPAVESGDPVEALRVLQHLQINLNRAPKESKDGLKRIREEFVPLVRQHLLTSHYAGLRKWLIEAVRRIDALYRGRKREANALDFTDLEERALRLLREREDIRERCQGHFEHVFMDELQDTNPLQWDIVKLIRRPGRFFGVGDINQAIYGFRHADPSLFEAYEREVRKRSGQIDELKKNYRTRKEVLDAIRWLMSSRPKFRDRDLEAVGAHPPRNHPAVEVAIAPGPAAVAGPVEAGWIASRVRELLGSEEVRVGDGRRLRPSDIAVLARKQNSLEPVAAALRRAGVPCRVAGGRTLLETREVRDLVLLLAAFGDVGDEISLAGVLRSPLVGLRDESLFRVRLLRPTLWGGLRAAAAEPPPGLDEVDAERIRWFAGLADTLRANRDHLSPDRLLARVVDDSGYLGGLDPSARANVAGFLSLVGSMHESRPVPVAEHVERLRRLRGDGQAGEAPPPEGSEAVQLMTMHAAKGLEFPVVFLAALAAGTLSGGPAVCHSPDHLLGARWIDPATGKAAPDLAYAAVAKEAQSRRAEEEWRLLYVAMTRAEEHLALSWAGSRGSEWTEGLLDTLGGLPQGETEREVPVPESGGVIRLRRLETAPAPADATLDLPSPPEPLRIGPPPREGQHNASVSATDVGLFAVCPRRYYLGRYLGLRPSVEFPATARDLDDDAGGQPPAGAAELGTEVHRLLAGGPVGGAPAEAVRLVEEFLETGLARRIWAAPRVEREFDFAVVVPGVVDADEAGGAAAAPSDAPLGVRDVIVTGQIDVWFEEDGRTVLADYKTDRFDPDEEPGRLRPYQLQLSIYAHALERYFGARPREALLYFLRSGKTVAVDIGEEAWMEALRVLRDLCAAQHALSFPLREGEWCRRCEFHARECPAGR